MRPAIGGMYRLGGSHAQQDVLEQLFVDAAFKAGSTVDSLLALECVVGRRAIPPERFIGWREAADRAAGALSGAMVWVAPLDFVARLLPVDSATG
jgi:hypothetical protein